MPHLKGACVTNQVLKAGGFNDIVNDEVAEAVVFLFAPLRFTKQSVKVCRQLFLALTGAQKLRRLHKHDSFCSCRRLLHPGEAFDDVELLCNLSASAKQFIVFGKVSWFNISTFRQIIQNTQEGFDILKLVQEGGEQIIDFLPVQK